MTIFFTSDLHVGDRSVARYRGFGDDGAPYHDETLARRWDRVVHDDDEVWVLGDVSGSRNRQHVLDWISDRTGTKHLITGNNDAAHPMYADAAAALPLYLEVFESVASAGRQEWILPGDVPTEVLLSHFPYGSLVSEGSWRPDEWRELPDLPGYLISPHGQVKGRFGRVLRPYVMPNGGYHQITISGVGKRTVHRLVARAYHGDPGPGMEVAHNNGDPADNRAVNLRWVTRSENMKDAAVHGTLRGGSLPGENNPNAKLTADQAAEIRLSSEPVSVLVDRYGVGESQVRRIRAGHSWRRDVVAEYEPEPRFEQWRLEDLGVPIIHGHTHRRETVTYSQRNTLQIHVGVDAWNLMPVPQDRVMAMMIHPAVMAG